MSEPEPDLPGTEPSGADAIRALARMEQRMVRLTFWQTLLSLAGAAIAIVALYAALVESGEVRRQTAAAVWPFVQVRVVDFDDGEGAGFRLDLGNAGVGPARVRTLRLDLQGQAMADWDTVVGALGQPGNGAYQRDFIGNRVLSPGETVQVFGTTDPALARAMQAAVRDPGTGLEYCYCSIFDDCFLADSRQPEADPRPVERCPDFGDLAFRG